MFRRFSALSTMFSHFGLFLRALSRTCMHKCTQVRIFVYICMYMCSNVRKQCSMPSFTSCLKYCFVLFLLFSLFTFPFYDCVILFSFHNIIFLPFAFILSLIKDSHLDNTLIVLLRRPLLPSKIVFTPFKTSLTNLYYSQQKL